MITGLVALAETMGLPYEGVITGLGVGGIALAFAARDTVSNLLGGAILMADRPFKQGDMVETDQGLATVETVGLRSTRLRTLDDSLLIIPNAQLSDRAIFNWGRRRKRKLLLQIGLTHDTPRDRLDRFVDRLSEVYHAQDRADETSGWVGMTGFGASSIDIELWGYFRVPSYDEFVVARHALMGDIVELAREVGVSFAFRTHPALREALAPLGGAIDAPCCAIWWARSRWARARRAPSRPARWPGSASRRAPTPHPRSRSPSRSSPTTSAPHPPTARSTPCAPPCRAAPSRSRWRRIRSRGSHRPRRGDVVELLRSDPDLRLVDASELWQGPVRLALPFLGEAVLRPARHPGLDRAVSALSMQTVLTGPSPAGEQVLGRQGPISYDTRVQAVADTTVRAIDAALGTRPDVGANLRAAAALSPRPREAPTARNPRPDHAALTAGIFGYLAPPAG